jgi:hypothetical protein
MLIFTKLNLLNEAKPMVTICFFVKNLNKLPEMQQTSKKQNDLTHARINVLTKCLKFFKKRTDRNVKTS